MKFEGLTYANDARELKHPYWTCSNFKVSRSNFIFHGETTSFGEPTPAAVKNEI
jgi:hypothetical protein